jgi:hypothetical protein
MRVAAELCAVGLISRYQSEEKIGAASSENGLFIAEMEFSIWAGDHQTFSSDMEPKRGGNQWLA